MISFTFLTLVLEVIDGVKVAFVRLEIKDDMAEDILSSLRDELDVILFS